MACINNELRGPTLMYMDQAVEKAIGQLRDRYNLPAEQVVVRALIPQDFTTGTTQKLWQQTGITSSGNTANSGVYNFQVKDYQYLVINGVSVSSSEGIAQIEISRSGALTRLWNIQYANNQDDRTQYFNDPVVIEENNTLNIDFYATSTGTKNVVFLGCTVEKKGITVAC